MDTQWNDDAESGSLGMTGMSESLVNVFSLGSDCKQAANEVVKVPRSLKSFMKKYAAPRSIDSTSLISEEESDVFTALPSLKSSMKKPTQQNAVHEDAQSSTWSRVSFAPTASMWDNESKLGMALNGSMAAAVSIAQFPRSLLT